MLTSVRSMTMCSWIILIAASAPCGAQEAPAQAPLQAAIDGMRSQDFQERERACQELHSLYFACSTATPCVFERLMEAAIIEAARSDDAPLEARLRLTGVLRDKFIRTPRAAIGIAFGGQTPMGITIDRTLPTFPGHELGLLKPNDVITSIDGVDVTPGADPTSNREAQELVRSIVLSHDPGDLIRVTLFRASLIPNDQPQVVHPNVIESRGQTLEVLVPLGKYGDLDLAQGVPAGSSIPAPLEAPWRIKLQRLGLSELGGPALTPMMTASDWMRFRAPPRPAVSVLTVDASEQPGEFEDINIRAEIASGAAIAGVNRMQNIQMKNGRFIQPALEVRGNQQIFLELQANIDQLSLLEANCDLQLGRFNESLTKGALTPQLAENLRKRIEATREQRESFKSQRLRFQNMLAKLRAEQR